MTSHLARLFRDTKDAPYAVSLEAKRKLNCLFHDHGEALVEVLGQLHGDCLASDFNEHWESYTAVQALLAAMEQEAGELFRNSEELEAS